VKVRVDVTATTAGEGSDGSSELAWVGVGTVDGSWNGSTVEEPDAETGRGPLDSVDTATDLVESVTVAADIS